MLNEICLYSTKDGKVVFDKKAKTSTTLDEICEFAENEFYGGYADYIRVSVNGVTYIEFEA